ncbi:immediate early response 2b [Scophthalmus maximus]|uniref:immediate early response 2b n=1 Tax=Scophthalmus maximus TaxID=52904 RepID=UPI001FA93EC0|nr:immediate early response 2b [Scophthalmus maximus]
MSATTAMEVNAEARRILAVSISKLYASRTQRGGLRLHRSLLLSLVMRSARDIYHSSRESEELCGPQPAAEEPEQPMDTGSRPGERAGLPEPQPRHEPALSPSPSSAPPPVPRAEEPASAGEGCDGETSEDKENWSPARRSRKRRGKASAAPDFLPSKRARLEPGEERYAAPLGSCRAAAGLSLSARSLNQVIAAF